MEISGRMDDVPQLQSDASKIYCDPCKHDCHQLVAEGYCVDCKEYLCSACYSVHRRPAVWRHHQLLDAQTMPKSKPATKVKDTCTEACEKHAEKNIEYFCNDHETFGCSVCMTTGHRACINVDYIPDIAATFDTSTELTEIKKQLLELFKLNQNNESDILSKSKAVDLQAKRAKAQIHNLSKEIIELFDRLENDIDINESIDDIKSTDETEMSTLAKETEAISRDLQNCISEIETKLDERKMCQLLIAIKRMKEPIGKIAKEIKRVAKHENIQRYSFKPNPVIVDMIQNLTEIGTLKFLDKNAKVAEFGCDFNVKAEDESLICNITGMTLVSENQVVIADDFNKSVKLLDVERKQLTSLYKTEKAESPFDVAAVKHLQIAVSYPSAKAIEFLTISESGSFRFERAINTTGDCHGIECSGNNLVVSFKNPSVVKILSINGRVIKTIKHYFENPAYVSVSPINNTIFVSTWFDYVDSVTCVTKDGKVTDYRKCDYLGGLQGIIIDQAGSVFVCCNFEDSILQLSEDCELLNSNDGIISPTCIAKTEQNTMFTGGYGDEIKMFKLY